MIELRKIEVRSWGEISSRATRDVSAATEPAGPDGHRTIGIPQGTRKNLIRTVHSCTRGMVTPASMAARARHHDPPR